MKIVNVNMSIDSARGGGTAERTVQMSKALVEAGHDCVIITLDIGINESKTKDLKGVEIVAFPCLSTRFYVPLFSFSKMKEVIKSADIVHLMGHWTLLNAISYLYIKRFKKKYVVCPAGALPLLGRSRALKQLFNFVIGKAIIKNANAHIIITPDEIPQFAAYDVTEKTIVWIPNGINPKNLEAKNDESFRQQFSIGNNPYILFIGRLNHIKGPDLLMQAFVNVKDLFPNYHLVVAGPDEGLLEPLKRIAISNKIDHRVHFTGPILGEVKSQGFHAADLMVIPSRNEAMSIVVLEAGITNLPVILTDRCGLNYLEDIKAGIVTEATIKSLTQGLKRALSTPVESKKMGDNLKQHVIENFLWTSIVMKFEEAYKKILKS